MDAMKAHNPDYMFWTGDNTAHDDPTYTQDEINAELGAVVDVVSAGLTGMDLTVSIGNHDAFPKC